MTAISDREGAVAARVSSLVADVVVPRAAAMARGELGSPRWVVDEAARRGLAGLLVPASFGGAEASHADFAATVEAIARACASSSVVYDVHVSVATEPILLCGSDVQKERYLPRLASGEWVGGFALSEPGSGSDAASLTTRATRVSGGWRLNGAKAWITNAGVADLFVVMARTGSPGALGITGFLVEAAWPGVVAEKPLHKLGLRGSWTAGLVLDDVHVPEENLLGQEGGGFRVAMAALDSGRIGISAQAVGIAQGALDVATKAVRAQGIDCLVDDVVASGGEVFEGVAARLPAPAARLAGMGSQVATARAAYRHAADMCDAGVPFTRAAAVAKLIATDAAVAVAHDAFELCGAAAQADDHPAAIRLRDAKACQIYEGTNQVQRVVIARKLLHS